MINIYAFIRDGAGNGIYKLELQDGKKIWMYQIGLEYKYEECRDEYRPTVEFSKPCIILSNKKVCVHFDENDLDESNYVKY